MSGGSVDKTESRSLTISLVRFRCALKERKYGNVSNWVVYARTCVCLCGTYNVCMSDLLVIFTQFVVVNYHTFLRRMTAAESGWGANWLLADQITCE